MLGNKLGGIALERVAGDLDLGLELTALANALLAEVGQVVADEGIQSIQLHFDELDQGMAILDEERSHMLIGLILAARHVRNRFLNKPARVQPVVYLRTDIWDDLEFSDKNKIAQSGALQIEWASDSLKDLINTRIASKLGNGVNWESVSTAELMRYRPAAQSGL